MSNYTQTKFGDAVNDATAFLDNAERRCPVLFLLDGSFSMKGRRIAELNAGLEEFRQAILDDPLASKRVDPAIVTFGPVRVVRHFGSLGPLKFPMLEAAGDTPMGEAIVTAFQLLATRVALMRRSAISYYRPWIVLVTDGGPTDEIVEAIRLVYDAEANGSCNFFAVGVTEADMGVLSRLSPRPPVSLKDADIRVFFRWISASMKAVSASRPGEKVALPAPTWAEV